MLYDRFTLEHRAFIIEHYFCTKSYAAVITAFKEEFEDVEPPNGSTIKRLVDKFRNDYTLDDLQRSGRPCALSESFSNTLWVHYGTDGAY